MSKHFGKRLGFAVLILGFFSLVACAVTASARSLIGGRGIPVVSEPKDLNLVNLRPVSNYMYADLKNKGDFGLVRRVALGVKARQMGIPNPRKNSMHAGMVIKSGASGHSSAVLVAVGDFKFKDVKDAMNKDYNEYMAQTRGTPAISEIEIAGLQFTKYSYGERPNEVCLAQVPKQSAWILATVPKGDFSVLDETIAVLKGEDKLNDAVPTNVEWQTTFQFSKREIERLVKFNRPKSALRAKFVSGMKTLARKLGIPQSDDRTVPLEERIRGQLAQSREVTMKYNWDIDARKASSYQIQCSIKAKDDRSADALKELISEQIVRLAELNNRSTDSESMGRLTVAASGDEVNLGFLLDTPEAQYEHVSLLLSQVFRYKNVMSFLDRHGQETEPPAAN